MTEPLSPVLVINLHRDERRHEHFAAHRDAPAFHDKSAQAFVTFNPVQAEAVLRCPDVRTIMCESLRGNERFCELAGIDLPNISFALKHIPLANDGETHREQRRRMVILMKERKPSREVVEAIVERNTRVLQQPGEVDMLNEVINPIIDENAEIYTKVAIPPDLDMSGLPTIFDGFIGRRKRVELDRSIAALRAVIRASLGELPEAEEGTILSFQMLGRDSILGTFGESLYQLFRQAPRGRLSDIALPPYPNETSVSVTERVADIPCVHAGQSFGPNEPVRLQLQSFAYSPNPADKSKIFGLGIHACLGRPMSMELWEALARRLATIPLKVEVLEHELRDRDYLFSVPVKFRIRLST